MRRSQAERYAQWALRTAIALVVVVAGVYAYRAWQARQVRKAAPPPVPLTVQQQSTTFSFSQKIQDRTLFTVRASRHIQFTEGSKSRLEDVWITIYGRQGQRFDNLHTRECNYAPESGLITCAGDVEIDLESAEEAQQRRGQRVIHVSTTNVSFNRNTGEAKTDSPVLFRFPYGQGRAVGVTYSTAEAIVRLHRDVEMTLTSAGAGRKPAEPVTLTGSGMEYHRDSRTMRLLSPVRVRQGAREISAGTLALEFDTTLRARRLVAGGSPQLVAAEPRGRLSVSAGEFVALFHSDGWVDRVAASGDVKGSWRLRDGSVPSGAGGEDAFSARRVELEMAASRNQPRLLTATGDVRVVSHPAGAARAVRTLQTPSLRLDFALATRTGERRLARGETLAPATVELATGDETTRLRSDRLAAEFNQRNQAQRLVGTGGAEIERRIAGRAPQTTRSREFAMRFGPGGAWTELEQTGDVRYQEDSRTAQAQQARMVRATDTVTLTGNAVVADALTRTTAPTIVIGLRNGDVRAEGGVRTSYLAAERAGITNLAPQPAHIAAEQLLANRDTGRALYSGRARLWQGDAVIEAPSIELNREARRMDARGGVRALFPQVAAAGERILWRVQSSTLAYWSAEGRARLEENVSAESRTGRIRAPTLDLFFSAPGGGAQQLARALAGGGVTLWARSGADERRGTAERAEYLVAEGKFILSGGHPTLFDASRGTTTGRQLTFFLADDRILVESEEGSRTLTKHRIEK
jgi:lipopolysaccharide export system protein LptA